LNAPVLWLHEIGMADHDQVGGKNSSLGEMIRELSAAHVSVPGGYATSAAAFAQYLAQDALDQRIAARLHGLNVEDSQSLAAAGAEIRAWIMATPLTASLEGAIRDAYRKLSLDNGQQAAAVAVRSSATAEDLPDASFAGQQETFLNVVGADTVVEKVHEVFASLFNDRAISYRTHHGFDHNKVYLSAGVQLMVRSDLASSGVMFTLDTESGFREVVLITASYGLGEMVVQGAVNPDEYYLYKPNLRAGRPALLRRQLGSKQQRMVFSSTPGERVRIEETPEADRQRFCLSRRDLAELGRLALAIEAHYGRPMDIEWGKDGHTGRIYILQARPETVRSRNTTIERFHLGQRGAVLVEGRAIGHRIGAGTARIVASVADIHKVQAGDVLVTDMTDPDWEPIMKKAAAIVTNRGGRTCHAAIIARELGIPAVVGCGDATLRVQDGAATTVSCAEGDTGFIYAGILPYERSETDLGAMPPAPLKIMMNVANPERAFDFAMLPNAGAAWRGWR